ncbi:hydrogenase formation protein HypD [Candidatus Fermentibacterales bacterium]|nr:hydrogenase formation protein HypD [Candidatus Fermentibacterales bacterium]
MKFVDEYRSGEAATAYAEALHDISTSDWTIMEVCGGQTHAIVRFGIDRLLPGCITLVHGPGCPVCVTPVSLIDKAIEIAASPGAVLCSFGDMLRVPGSSRDLFSARAEGGDVRTVYSPMDALDIARQEPESRVVFFAVGFETTAPVTAAAVLTARREKLLNFSLLVAHVRVPPAMEAVLSSPDNRVQGFLAAGHVCTVMGYGEYGPIASRFGVPIVVTGFEPLDILQGIHMCVLQLEKGVAGVENQYGRAVRPEGNPAARALMDRAFVTVDRAWRGLGGIPRSGLGLRPELSGFDAEEHFGKARAELDDVTAGSCLSGLVLRGAIQPADCPSFGRACTPEHPLGAPMVSSEGACAAYYRYGRNREEEHD